MAQETGRTICQLPLLCQMYTPSKQTNPDQMLTFTRWTNWFSDKLSNSGPRINGGKCLVLAVGMIKRSSYQPLWMSLAPWSRGHKSHVMTQISWLETSPKLPHTGQSEGATSSGRVSSSHTPFSCLVSPVELPMLKSVGKSPNRNFC